MLSLLPAAAAALSASLPAFSDFDLGDDGWTVTTREGLFSYAPVAQGPIAPAHATGGGDPGGFIEITDPDEHVTFFNAPPQDLGDRTDAIGGGIEWSIRTDACDFFAARLVILASDGYAISALADAEPAPGSWTRLRVPLHGGRWYLGTAAGSDNAEPAFQHEIDWFLERVDMLLISGETSAGTGETVALDSVRFTAACPGDRDLDGAVTVHDLLDFLAWFRAGFADHDRSGATEVNDLLAFLGDFRGGCGG